MTSGEPGHVEPDPSQWHVILPEIVTLPVGRTHEFPVHVKHGDDVVVTITQIRRPDLAATPVSAQATRELTQLDIWHEPQEVAGEQRGRATFEIPAELPVGYYRVELISDTHSATGLLLARPSAAANELSSGAAEATKARWGIAVDVPATRSHRSWNVGDLGDLAEVGVMAAEWGADFIYPRPQTLRGLKFEGEELAPAQFLPPTVRSRYLPTSILRVEEVPELAYLPAPDRALIEWEAEEFTAHNATNSEIEIGAAHQAKSAALDLIATVDLSAARRSEFEKFVAEQGPDLQDFALWAAIAETSHRAQQPWPEDAENPAAFGARRIGDNLSVEIEKHQRYQWYISQQFQRAHERARSAGMQLGLMRAALWDPQAPLADTSQWITAVTTGVGALRLTPQSEPTSGEAEPETDAKTNSDQAALATVMIATHLRGIPLILAPVHDSKWHEYAKEFGITVQTRPWKMGAGQITSAADEFMANELLELKTPLDVPLANYLAEEFVERLPADLAGARPEDVLRDARNVRDLLIRILANEGLIDDNTSLRALIEGLHVWAVQQRPRLTVLRLRDLLGQREWPGVAAAPNVPLLDGFDNPILIDDMSAAPTLLSLLRRFEIM